MRSLPHNPKAAERVSHFRRRVAAVHRVARADTRCTHRTGTHKRTVGFHPPKLQPHAPQHHDNITMMMMMMMMMMMAWRLI
jgi:hypothetical protein